MIYILQNKYFMLKLSQLSYNYKNCKFFLPWHLSHNYTLTVTLMIIHNFMVISILKIPKELDKC